MYIFKNNFYFLLSILFNLFIINTLSLAQDDTITATIIGSSAANYNPNRANASVLITTKDTKILVDMRNGTKDNLYKLGVDSKDIDALFLTHHHIDHNEEFVPLLIQILIGKNNEILVVGPPNTSKFVSTNLDLYKEDIEYRLDKSKRNFDERIKAINLKELKGGETFEFNNIKISTLKVPHTIYTIAYRFDYNNHSIVITGDTTYTEELAPFAKNSDVLIIDSGGMIMKGKKSKIIQNIEENERRQNRKKDRVSAHINLFESSLIAKNANVKKLVYTHFVPGTIDEEKSLEQIRVNYNGEVIFSQDLIEIKP
jgi:ribonuclease BN (tRNA processing enzyme)